MITKLFLTGTVAAGLMVGLAGVSAASPQYSGYKSEEKCKAGITKYGKDLGYSSPSCFYNQRMGYWEIR